MLVKVEFGRLTKDTGIVMKREEKVYQVICVARLYCYK